MNKIIVTESAESIKAHLVRQFRLQEDQIDLMLPAFLTTLQNHMDKLSGAFKQKDLLLIGKAGHTIKGAFLNLGLDECAQLALEIEIRGKQGEETDFDDFQHLYYELEKKIEPLLSGS